MIKDIYSIIFILFIVYFVSLFQPKIVIAENVSSTVTVKVMVVNFNPIIETRNNKKLTEIYNWNDPLLLSTQYINDVKQVSGNYVNYEIVEWNDVDDFPIKQNGFDFSDQSFLSCITNNNCDSNMANYQKILIDFGVCEKRNVDTIDELWLWGGPWFGYWEAVMAGPSAFDTNGPPITNTTCRKQLHIMGFNYERGVTEMLEDLGHRTEGVLSYVFNEDSRNNGNNNKTPWGRFVLTEKTSLGNSNCGWMHYAPNSRSDYDHSNQKIVTSNCEDWLNYPNLTGTKENFNCSRWNCNDYDFKKWWFNHLPKALGKIDGKWNNWWRYIIDYEKANIPPNGDINGDNKTDILDFNIFSTNFNQTNSKIICDINQDDVANIFDYNLLIKYFK